MKRIYRIAALLCMCTLMLSLAGCSKEGEEESKDTVIIRVLENDTAKSEGYLDELINAFNEEYKDKGIQAVDANMDEYTNLAENGPYGYGPDVIYQANDKLMTYAEDKHIIALNYEELECYSQIPKEAWDAFRISVDGKSYVCAVPVNIQEPMFFYREDMMPDDWEAKWDDNKNSVPDFFESWNDLYAYSKELRDADSSANKDSNYGYMASLNNLYMSAQFIFSYGGYVFGENEDGTLDSKDIGFSANDAAIGVSALKQLAGLMNEGCIDDTITMNRYEKLANGTYFCTVSTPDTYSVFVDKLALKYEENGMSKDEAYTEATKNLKMIELPRLLPKDGDLSTPSDSMGEEDFVESIVMGGVNGYGVSSYSEHREESIEFVEFAAGYEMIKKRAQMLGIAPARSDVAKEVGGVSDTIFNSLKEGRIYLMPSIKAVDQIWVPAQSMLADIAKDAFRKSKGETEKYPDVEAIKKALEGVDKNIYDSIYTLDE